MQIDMQQMITMQISAALEGEISGAICLDSDNNTQVYNLGLPASYKMADILSICMYCTCTNYGVHIYRFWASSVLRVLSTPYVF